MVAQAQLRISCAGNQRLTIRAATERHGDPGIAAIRGKSLGLAQLVRSTMLMLGLNEQAFALLLWRGIGTSCSRRGRPGVGRGGGSHVDGLGLLDQKCWLSVIRGKDGEDNAWKICCRL